MGEPQVENQKAYEQARSVGYSKGEAARIAAESPKPKAKKKTPAKKAQKK